MVNKKMEHFDVSIIRKVFDRGTTLTDPVNLSIGMPDFDVEEDIKDALCKAVHDGSNAYTTTQGLPELRERIARKLKDENHLSVSPENILVTCGVSGALDLAFRVLINPGDEIIISDPAFGMYKELIKLSDGVPVHVRTYPDFQMTADRIAENITEKTKAIMLNTPNNPTGAVYPRDEVERIAKLAEKHDLVVISDEIYEKYVYEEEHVSIGRFYGKTLTINGLSKSAGMTGWRIGWAAGPGDIIDAMCKLQQYTYVCAPSMVQRAAIDAFDTDIQEHIRRYDEHRRALIREFPGYTPRGAFYMMIETPCSGTEFAGRLFEKGLMVVPGAAFSEKDTHIRISYAVSEKTLNEGIRIIKEEL